MFGWFKHKPLPVFDGPKYPNAQEAEQWMQKRVQYYLDVYDNTAYRLFDPSTGDYMPIFVHVGSCWNDDRQAEYRRVKQQYPQLVQQAKQSFYTNGQYNQSRVGDPEDFDSSVRLLP